MVTPPSYVKPSRSELVTFVNKTLNLSISKIDELGNGAVYCQLLDTIYGDLPMSRINFETRAQFEMQQNHKILQQVFLRHGIKYEFDSTKLMKCRFQDNLEFSQWIYQFWHENPHIPDYDPVARRNGQGVVTGNAPGNRLRLAQNGLGIRNVNTSNSSISTISTTPGSRGSFVLAQQAQSQPQASQQQGISLAKQQEEIKELRQTISALEEKNAKLEEENFKLNNTVEVVHYERQMYYEKLTEVESILEKGVESIYGESETIDSNDKQADMLLELIRKIRLALYVPDKTEEEPF